MDPTFAYWATAQEAMFSAEYTQVATTKEAVLAFATQFPQLCGFTTEAVSVSPNGEWIAADCWLSGDYFRVFQTHGDQVWDVPYSAVMKYYPNFIGSMNALHWSPDGSTLYFTSSSCCADIDSMSNGGALYRLDLQTGVWELMIAGSFNYYSFSPNGKYLLYILDSQAGKSNSVRLHLLALRTGNEETIVADGFEQAGWAVWKQDGQKIALAAQTGSLYSDDRKDALIVADLQKLEWQTVIPLSEDRLAVKGWSNDDILTIRRANVMEYNDYYVNVFEIVFYDLKNNLFITPTPAP